MFWNNLADVFWRVKRLWSSKRSTLIVVGRKPAVVYLRAYPLRKLTQHQQHGEILCHT